MRVSELLEELKDVDPEREVFFQYTETGGCCCNSYEDTEEVSVSGISEDYQVQDGWEKKKSGGRFVPKYKTVVLLTEY